MASQAVGFAFAVKKLWTPPAVLIVEPLRGDDLHAGKRLGDPVRDQMQNRHVSSIGRSSRRQRKHDESAVAASTRPFQQVT